MTQPTLTHEFPVENRHSADALGNPGVLVLGTPYLLLFMELASQYLMVELEGEDTISVGISANFKHLGATPVGSTVTVTTTLLEKDRRRYLFHCRAEDEQGLVGEGEHERFRVADLDKFLEKSMRRGD